MKKAEKTFFVENLSSKLKSATAVVLVDYSHLTVKMQQDLKKRLKEVGASMEVAKNTLFKLAGKDAKIAEEAVSDTVLTGPMALVITEGDPVAPIQILGKFAKEFVSEDGSPIPQFKIGVVEGSFQDKDMLIKISTLPGKDALFGQVIGTVAQPLYGIVGVLQGNLQKLIWVLQEKAKMN